MLTSLSLSKIWSFDKEKLSFTNTDSLTYQIDTEDVYKDFWADKNKFHNSEYAENSPFSDKTNKKVIGKFKDEASEVRRFKINVSLIDFWFYKLADWHLILA